MKKLSLDLGALAVESFVAGEGRTPSAGTVHAKETDFLARCGTKANPFTWNSTDTLNGSCQFSQCTHCDTDNTALTTGPVATQGGNTCATQPGNVTCGGGTCDASCFNCPTGAGIC